MASNDASYRPLLQDDAFDTLPTTVQSKGDDGKPLASSASFKRDSVMLNAAYNQQIMDELHYVAKVINPRARMHNILLISNTFLLLSMVLVLLILVFGMNKSMNKMNDNMNSMQETMQLMNVNMNEMLITMKNMNENMMKKMDVIQLTADKMIATMTNLMTAADTHALNVIYNTYQMCNVMTVGLEKGKGCRLGFGFPNGVPTVENPPQ
eukprot:Opistho-2@59381